MDVICRTDFFFFAISGIIKINILFNCDLILIILLLFYHYKYIVSSLHQWLELPIHIYQTAYHNKFQAPNDPQRLQLEALLDTGNSNHHPDKQSKDQTL